MQTNETAHWIEFSSSDSNGEFTVKIIKDYPVQIQVSTENGLSEVFFDVDKKELTEIRDMINKVLN